jgi:transcriptional regulator with XRE-family HTH domain
MSSYPSGIAALNWQSLVQEAIRRRRAEKLTQKEHAALASVSVPTMVSFDRGEESLTLAKAFAILRVVGLIDQPSKEGAQEAFVQEALRRWRELTTPLAEDSPGRFPHGWYRIDYALEGEIEPMEPFRFKDILEKAVVRHTGWPMFLFLTRHELPPNEIDGVIECWLKPEDAGANRPFGDAAHCDFWRAAPEGRAFIMRGYQEDSQETFAPRTIFDITLPTWRMGEALLHAENLAKLMAKDINETKVRLRAHYTGLSGRVLRNWGNPASSLMFDGGASRSDEALLETTVPAADISKNLAEILTPMAGSLFERFGVTGLSVESVASEVKRLTQNTFGSVRS